LVEEIADVRVGELLSRSNDLMEVGYKWNKGDQQKLKFAMTFKLVPSIGSMNR